MKDEDFSKYPKSIGEARADASSKASDWTPREVLIALLREIDSGTRNIDALVVSFRYSGNKTSFYAAVPDGLTLLGLLERTKFRTHEVADGG